MNVKYKIPQLFLAAALICSVASGIGCRTTNTYSRADSAPEKNVIDDKRVVWDPLLGFRAQVLEIIESETDSGFPKVQVEIRNNGFLRKRFEYRFEWFDESGIQVESSSSAYKVQEILGRERVYISGTAPTRDVKDFKLKLIRTRR